MLESTYKTRLTKKLRRLFPGCLILRNDANYLQGVPDILILFGDRWAALEGKASPEASHQPNQDYYVDLMNQMSFAAFIDPSNEAEVLHALQQAFDCGGSTRFS